VRLLAAQGFAAVKRGDAYAARDLLTRVVQAGAADAGVWFAMAAAYRQLDSSAEESHALDQVLKFDPNHLPALIGKGDVFARQGDERAASSHYGAAIRLAKSLRSLPTEWRAELARVTAARQRTASNFEAHLVSELAARGLGEAGTSRISHAIDLLLGKRQVFLQQPTNFYFPELPQIEFYDRRDFPWVKALERLTPRIRAEVQTILGETGWAPYIENETRGSNSYANPLLQDPNWSAFYLIKNGSEVALNARRCPATMAAVRELPLCRTDRTPAVLFSLLRPGTRIRPHHGFMNTRLICHLPLIIPEECALRVGNETRAWREGEIVLFDDSVEHEAWNLSKKLRVVMIFDVWRPELSEKERTLVSAMIEAADQFDRLPHRVSAGSSHPQPASKLVMT
jgi:aspartyl/asparaginyl beta-hydroxylase (cupin superfamily)